MQIEMPNRTVIIRGHLVAFPEDFHGFFFHHTHFYARLRGHGKPTHTTSIIEGLLHGRKRHVDALFLIAAKIHIGVFRREHANHLKIDAIDADVFAHRVFVILEKNFTHPFANHHHLSFQINICFVDKASDDDIGRINEVPFRIIAKDAEGTCFIVSHHIVAAVSPATAFEARGKDGKFLDTAFQCRDVVVVVGIPAISGQTFVGNGGGARPHKHAVGGKIAHAVHHTIFQAAARTEHHHEHEDAPKHTKGGEGGAQLVFGEAAPYFVPSVAVKHHNGVFIFLYLTIAQYLIRL